MHLINGFTICCKAKDLKKELKKAMKGSVFIGDAALPDLCYDYYFEFDKSSVIGSCDHCGEDLTTNDEGYDINGDMIHGDCLYDYMSRYKL